MLGAERNRPSKVTKKVTNTNWQYIFSFVPRKGPATSGKRKKTKKNFSSYLLLCQTFQKVSFLAFIRAHPTPVDGKRRGERRKTVEIGEIGGEKYSMYFFSTLLGTCPKAYRLLKGVSIERAPCSVAYF